MSICEHVYWDDNGREVRWSAPDVPLEPFEEPPIQDIVFPVDLNEYYRCQEAILSDLYPDLED